MIADKLHALRKDKGWTKRELARRSGLNEVHIAKIEGGTRKSLEVETLRKLCLALDCTADYLIGLEDDPTTWDQAADPEPLPPPPPGPRRPRGRPRKHPLAAAGGQP